MSTNMLNKFENMNAIVYRFSVIAAFILVICSGALAAPIGLVLSGGGARGAYEVGVWRAFSEQGLSDDIRAISGTSVGAMNGALFASVSDQDKIEELWLKHIGEIMCVNTNNVRVITQGLLNDIGTAIDLYNTERNKRIDKIAKEQGIDKSELSEDDLKKIEKDSKTKAIGSFLLNRVLKLSAEIYEILEGDDYKEGFVTSRRLKEFLTKNIPTRWDEDAPAVYATALCKVKDGEKKRYVLCLKGKPHEEQVSYILASTAIPVVFDNATLDGRNYVDGGWEAKGGDNVPIEPIIENHPEIKRIYVVYLNAENEIKRRIDKSKYPDKEIIEIIPSENMGGVISGTLNFDADRAKELIELGYKDAMNVLADAVYKSDDDKAE